MSSSPAASSSCPSLSAAVTHLCTNTAPQRRQEIKDPVPSDKQQKAADLMKSAQHV